MTNILWGAVVVVQVVFLLAGVICLAVAVGKIFAHFIQ